MDPEDGYWERSQPGDPRSGMRCLPRSTCGRGSRRGFGREADRFAGTVLPKVPAAREMRPHRPGPGAARRLRIEADGGAAQVGEGWRLDGDGEEAKGWEDGQARGPGCLVMPSRESPSPSSRVISSPSASVCCLYYWGKALMIVQLVSAQSAFQWKGWAMSRRLRGYENGSHQNTSRHTER